MYMAAEKSRGALGENIMMRTRWRLLILGGITAVLGSLGALAADPGFFANGAVVLVSTAQAARGQIVYDNNCSGCHGVHLDDGEFGPPLRGPMFKANWSPQSTAALFSFIVTKMPPNGAGTLSQGAYADVEAYLLSANGVAAGSADLVPARLQAAAQSAGRAVKHDAVYEAALAARHALLSAMAPVSDAMLRHPADTDWLVWRRTYQNLSFSPLKQITKANARDIGVAWTVNLAPSANEITPLVHDGVMFIESGTTIEALNTATGEQLWQYVRPLDNLRDRDLHQKNMGIYQDKLYAPTADGHVLALEAATGRLVWDHQIAEQGRNVYNAKVSNTVFHVDGGPLIAKGKVVIGVSLGTAQGGGNYIVGLDAQTGSEAWRFSTIAKPGEPGGDSWNGAPYDQRFGAGVWQSGSYDPDLGLVYFGTGNTYDTDTLLQPQPHPGTSKDALYTDSTLALNPDTGKLAWYYQHMNRDVWDLDWVFEQSLITLPVNGVPTKLLVTGGKLAIFDAVNRATGKYAFSRDLGLQTLVSAIDPVTGQKIISSAAEPAPGKSSHFCSAERNWPTTAYDPATHILYVPTGAISCADYSWPTRDAAAVAKGGVDYRRTGSPASDNDGKFGRIQAINLITGKTIWTERQRATQASSLLTTAGGVLFSGGGDRQFSAYDSATGKRLWQIQLNAAPSSSPITFATKGQQYVAVVAGIGGPISSSITAATPEIYSPPPGTTLWVFKLKH
jgi:alcohol dehydrogenase (cytochrome c)